MRLNAVSAKADLDPDLHLTTIFSAWCASGVEDRVTEANQRLQEAHAIITALERDKEELLAKVLHSRRSLRSDVALVCCCCFCRDSFFARVSFCAIGQLSTDCLERAPTVVVHTCTRPYVLSRGTCRVLRASAEFVSRDIVQ